MPVFNARLIFHIIVIEFNKINVRRRKLIESLKVYQKGYRLICKLTQNLYLTRVLATHHSAGAQHRLCHLLVLGGVNLFTNVLIDDGRVQYLQLARCRSPNL